MSWSTACAALASVVIAASETHHNGCHARHEEHLGKIALDCNDWRRLRTEELKLTAQVAAERVVESGDPFALSPMNPRERRIIHLALRDRPNLRTVSEGVGPERKVVILPARPPTRDSGR